MWNFCESFLWWIPTCVPKVFFKGAERGGEGWHMNLTWLSGHIEWTFIDSCLDLLTYWLCPHCPDSFEEKDNIGISASMHHPRDFGASPEQNEVAIEYNCLAALLLQFSNLILDTTIKLKESLRKWFLFSVFSLLPFRERYQTTLSPLRNLARSWNNFSLLCNCDSWIYIARRVSPLQSGFSPGKPLLPSPLLGDQDLDTSFKYTGWKILEISKI